MIHRQILRIYSKYCFNNVNINTFNFNINKANLHIEQFKIKVLAANSFDDMRNILKTYFDNKGNYHQQNTKNKDNNVKSQVNQSIDIHKFNPSLFAIACRSYARIIRRTKHNQLFNCSQLLGSDYDTMKHIDLKQLSLSELVDIANFLCMVPDKTFINPTHPIVKQFVHNLLSQILKPYKEQSQFSKQLSISTVDRQLSYLLKSARCAQMYFSPLYSQYLTCINAIIQRDVDLFYSMASMNFISKGKASSQDFIKELAIVQAALDKYIRQKWLGFNQVHHIIDFLTPMEEYFNNLGFLQSKAGQKLLNIRDQLREWFIKQYENLSGQQITRVVKLLAKYNQNEPLLRKILVTCMDSISSTGSSTIDSIFIMRFILFAKNFSKYSQICSDWQQKVLALVRYYYVTKFDPSSPQYTINDVLKKSNVSVDRIDISMRSIFNSLVQCMQEGMLTHNSSIQMSRIMFQHVKKIGAINPDYFNKNISIIFNLCALFLKFRMMQELDQIVKILGIDWPQHFRGFLYYMHLELVQKYIAECSNPPKLPQFRCVRKNLLTKSMTDIKTSNYLYQTYNTLKLKNQFFKVPMYFLQSTVSTLKYTHQYSQILQVIRNLPDNCAQIQLIARQLLLLPIPQIHHDSFIKCFNQKFQTSQQSSKDSRYVRSYPLLVLNELKHYININMRQSSSQAKYYHKLFENIRQRMKIVQSQQEQIQKYRLVYCDNVVISFFMKFNRKQFVNSVIQTVTTLLQEKKQTVKKDIKNNRKSDTSNIKKDSQSKSSAISIDQWESLGIRILSCMIEDAVPIKQVRQFMQIIEKYGFATKQMFLYYCEMTIRKGLYRPQILQQIAQKSNIVVSKAQLSSIIPVYPEYTQSVHQLLNIQTPQKQNINKVMEYFKQANTLMKSHNESIKMLALDAICVTVHCLQNKTVFDSQPSALNKLPQLLYKISLDQSTPLVCQIKILQVSLNYKLYMPKLFDRVQKSAHIEGDYKFDIPADNVLKILTEYPQESQTKQGWSIQFVNTLITVCGLCPDYYSVLNQKVKQQIGQNYNKPEWKNIKNSLQFFVRATKIPVISKQQKSQVRSGLFKK